MVTSDPSAIVNAVICAVIVGALMFYRRDGSKHRPHDIADGLLHCAGLCQHPSVSCLACTSHPTGWWYWQTFLSAARFSGSGEYSASG